MTQQHNSPTPTERGRRTKMNNQDEEPLI